MADTVIDWDGATVPPELHVLPPGKYVLSPLEEDLELTPDEERAVREGLEDVKAGRLVSFEKVLAHLEPLTQG